MTRAQIIAIQRKVGTIPDGFWGPKSIAACQKYLRAIMPLPNPAPATDQLSLTRAYGKPGDTSKHQVIDVKGLGVKYEGKSVLRINVNSAAADSLLAALKELSTFPEGRAALAQYAGVYNNRPMRGGSLPSLHARAAAIDLAPIGNGLHTAWPTRASMPFSVIETFARHGWKSAAAWWGRDSMHFERTR